MSLTPEKISQIQIYMQLYDKMCISKKTLLSELGIDDHEEMKLIKKEIKDHKEIDKIFKDINSLKCNSMKIKKFNDNAKLPTRKHSTDAGVDIYSLEDVFIAPHEMKVVKTGIMMQFPKDTVALVWPKSRSNFLIGAGVIDCDYQGEILIKVTNVSKECLKINKHQGVAQIVITPVICPSIKEVDEIHTEESARGETGGIAGNSKD